jgi:hypothetical protein
MPGTRGICRLGEGQRPPVTFLARPPEGPSGTGNKNSQMCLRAISSPGYAQVWPAARVMTGW